MNREQIDRLTDRVAEGEFDRELFNYFDGPQIMRIARNFACTNDLELARSRVLDDLTHVKQGIAEWIYDTVEDGGDN